MSNEFNNHPSSLKTEQQRQDAAAEARFHTTPIGARVLDIPVFDRSRKVVFHCPDHPGAVYVSKNPYSSTWFPASDDIPRCPPECRTTAGNQIVALPYTPTRNG